MLIRCMLKCCYSGLSFPIVGHHQQPDPPHSLRLLRTRRERPCRRAAQQRDEVAPPHGAYPQAKDQ